MIATWRPDLAASINAQPDIGRTPDALVDGQPMKFKTLFGIEPANQRHGRARHDSAGRRHQGDVAIGIRRTVTDMTFEPNGFDDGLKAPSDIGAVHLFVEDAKMWDQDGVPLSKYPWYVMMDETKNADIDRRIADFLGKVFDALAETGRYGCWLVYDFGNVIATNDRDVTM
jgi:hypothetical protein